VYKAEFTNPPDDRAPAIERANQLLRSVMPEHIANALLNDGYVEVQGKQFKYVLSLRARTVIPNYRSLCIEFVTISTWHPNTNLDRLVMEYLLIKGNEELYLRTCF